MNGCSDKYVHVEESLSDTVAGTIYYLEKITTFTIIILICTCINLFLEFMAKKMFHDDDYKS